MTCSIFKPVLGLALLAAHGAQADTGDTGGWAADPADCRFVSDRVSVTESVTAGIITPENAYFYGGKCSFSKVNLSPYGVNFTGLCNRGDGAYKETLETKPTGPDTMRAKWRDIGWTSFHRCWELPVGWKKRSR